MAKNYSVKEIDEGKLANLSKWDNLTRILLWNRGIKTEEEANHFLNPDFDLHLHDPFLLPDMEKAVDRILHAISNNEKIAIWSDYDADGIPGGALLYDFFKKIKFNNFINYIPDRHNEGYGLNHEGINELYEAQVKLIITVDCGVRDNEEVSEANKKGMEVIITDHHEPGKELPEAYAIVNHKRIDSKYPESVLCGSGVVWKLIEAILIKKRELLPQGSEKWMLDLAGIATLSDMVPLTGENRALAHFGLKVLRKTKRPGLKKLYSILRINQNNLTEDDIGFLITPRINAASRMGLPKDAFELLTTNNYARGDELAKHLDSINKERKSVVATIVKEAKHHIKNRFENLQDKKIIVLGNPDWRPALLGLAANSIAEEFKRPVFLWGREGGELIKGSCRSDGVTDLVELMERAKSSFIDFGGHKFSGGFSVDMEKIHTLETDLLEASNHVLQQGQSEFFADAILKIKDVNINTSKIIESLSPFGMENPKPIFIFPNVIAEKINRFGKGKEHLEVTLRDGLHTTRAIGFFCTPSDWEHCLKEGMNTNIAASIENSFFGGRNEVRLRIVDFF